MNTVAEFSDAATRILFFTGKGGVGKTSLSCATAIALAGRGKRVLLVSTDTASNLDEVLGVRLSSDATAIPGAPGLSALNIDPEAAAQAYRERVVGPHRGVLPDAAVTSMEEQLSGACTVEIAAFDEFTKLLGDPEATSHFDHIIFDTAPARSESSASKANRSMALAAPLMISRNSGARRSSGASGKRTHTSRCRKD